MNNSQVSERSNVHRNTAYVSSGVKEMSNSVVSEGRNNEYNVSKIYWDSQCASVSQC